MPSAAAVLRRLRSVREPWWVAAATLFSFIVTVWWITQDNQVPDPDEAKHLLDAITVRTEILTGHLSAPFTDFNSYPPLVHLVGAIGMIISGGVHVSAALLADNIFFLPMLAGGCYAAGCAVYNRRAGLLAAVFALGAPMIVSEMREYYVDPGEAAMVAATVGAILASRRFERVGVSALAGILCALGSLTKETFVLFVGGLVAVVVLRGGWRNWRGLLLFVLLGGGLGMLWYIDHLSQLNVLTQGATAGGPELGNANAGAGITPPRYSSANIAWYFWDLVNHQLLAPLTVFFLIGSGLALWRFARTRDRNDLTPELVVGGLVGYLGVTYITLKDPRYSLPAMVYVAVLATGWLTTLPLRPRRLLTTGLALLIAANFAMVSFGWGSAVTLTLPGAPTPSIAQARVITFFSPGGWLHGAPVRDGNLLGLIEALKRLHFKYMGIDQGSTTIPDFNWTGLGLLSIEAGLPEWPYALSQLGPNDAFLLRHFPVAGDPPPCQRLVDGSGVYVEVGNPLATPFTGYEFVCPGHKPLYYHRTGPPPESTTHVITGPLRTTLLTLFRAMKKDGVRSAEFDPSMGSTPYMDNIGLQALANMEDLSVPPVNDPSNLAPKQAYMLLHSPVQGDARPCVDVPGGYGIYMVLGGNAVVPFDDYRYYCPLRTPHFYQRPG